jgi:hypothetical protein
MYIFVPAFMHKVAKPGKKKKPGEYQKREYPPSSISKDCR